MPETNDNYYYNRVVKEQGKPAADAIMRKIAPAGGKTSRGGGFAAETNKNGLSGRQQAAIAGRKSGQSRRRKK